MSYDLLFNLGLNTCRGTNIILLKFKTYLINSFQKKFIYHLVILAYLNLSSFEYVKPNCQYFDLNF